MQCSLGYISKSKSCNKPTIPQKSFSSPYPSFSAKYLYINLIHFESKDRNKHINNYKFHIVDSINNMFIFLLKINYTSPKNFSISQLLSLFFFLFWIFEDWVQWQRPIFWLGFTFLLPYFLEQLCH